MNEPQFKTNYGRIKPFILAFARSKFYFKFHKWEHMIVRMHTDSIALTEVPADLVPSADKLGYLKKEFEGLIEINGLNKFTKHYIKK